MKQSSARTLTRKKKKTKENAGKGKESVVQSYLIIQCSINQSKGTQRNKYGLFKGKEISKTVPEKTLEDKEWF